MKPALSTALASFFAALILTVGCERPEKESEITVELPGGAIMEMVWIQPGVFEMGGIYPMWQDNERPSHEVEISRGFYLGKYEVTQAQWESVMGTRPWKGQVANNANAPATFVSWSDAQAFIDALNKAVGDELYRLPTDAEWEHACRAGTRDTWHFGSYADTLVYFAWYSKNAQRFPSEAGQKLPNPWGLHDMHGNVAEWCSDWYDDEYPIVRKIQKDPQGPDKGEHRVIRGGDYLCNKWHVTAATRMDAHPIEKSRKIGFRLLRIK